MSKSKGAALQQMVTDSGRSELHELLQTAQTVEALTDAISGRPSVEMMVAAIHRAVLKEIAELTEVQYHDSHTWEQVEGWSRYTASRAAAIYAIAVNWEERDMGGRNPALAAVLDEIEFEGERLLSIEREIQL